MSKTVINDEISLEEFKNYYWTKKELSEFCKTKGIDDSGLKFDVEKRIEIWIQTGVVQKKKKTKKINNEKEELTLNTVVDEKFKRNKYYTSFIRTHCPDFHYTYWMNRYIEEEMNIMLS